MLFLFKFYSFVFSFFGLHCSSFFLSQHTLVQNRKRCQTSFAKSFTLFPLQVFLVFLSPGLHRTFCSALLLSPFFCQFFSFSFFAKNQMCLTLKIMAQYMIYVTHRKNLINKNTARVCLQTRVCNFSFLAKCQTVTHLLH